MRIPWLWRARAGSEHLTKPGFAEEAVPNMEAVYRFALRLTSGDEAAAEDVLQETFVRAYRAWESYAPGTSCRSWLFTICRREFLRLKGRESHGGDAVVVDVDPDTEALAAAGVYESVATSDPEATFFNSLIDREVTAALDGLPVEFRETIVLSDMYGLSYPEVAQVLGVPVGTVKSRLYRGRRLLEKALYEYALEMGYVRRGNGS